MNPKRLPRRLVRQTETCLSPEDGNALPIDAVPNGLHPRTIREGRQTMSVRVNLSPMLRRKYRPDCDPNHGLVLEDGSGKTLRQIVQELGIPLEEVSSVLVNHRVVQPSYVAKNDDLILLAVAIGGG